MDNKIRVFLSRPNPFTEIQQFFIEKLFEFLNNKDFECVTLQAAEYSPYEVMISLKEMIQRSYGIVILAFGQTFITEGIRKKDAENNPDFFSSKEIYLKNKWITSVYCHIEGILALSLGLPILTIPQEKLVIEGILKHGEYSITTPEVTLNSKEDIISYLNSNAFLNSFQEWEQLIKKKYQFIKNGECHY